MKKLIQQLGEAIHESVSESEQIAGVVQDIRRHGFDVLLMLEATIGLNEVEQQPSSIVAASKSADHDGSVTLPDGGGFTSQDLKFLRSLRISMQDDEARAGNKEEA
jgi:hypothetical protein